MLFSKSITLAFLALGTTATTTTGLVVENINGETVPMAPTLTVPSNYSTTSDNTTSTPTPTPTVRPSTWYRFKSGVVSATDSAKRMASQAHRSVGQTITNWGNLPEWNESQYKKYARVMYLKGMYFNLCGSQVNRIRKLDYDIVSSRMY